MILQDRVALITGSSSGIGRGVALAMAAAGADVIVNHPSDVFLASSAGRHYQGQCLSPNGGDVFL